MTRDALSRERRRELMDVAVQFYKSGAEPVPEPTRDHFTRAEYRQAARAFGFRGAKAKRHNLERNMRRVAQAVRVDEALRVAKDRVEHPVRSRLRGNP